MAPLMWADTTPLSDPNQPPSSDISSRAISWLWHDLTTLRSYDVELANVDRTNFAGAHAFRKATKQKAGQGAAAQGARDGNSGPPCSGVRYREGEEALRTLGATTVGRLSGL